MARVATWLELALVRISMAVGAIVKLQACVANLIVRAGGMAALAEYVAMLASERVLCFGVIEVLAINGRAFPVTG